MTSNHPCHEPHSMVRMSWHTWTPIRGPANSQWPMRGRDPVMKGWARWSGHTLHTITLCLLRLGPHDPDTDQASTREYLLGPRFLRRRHLRSWGLSCAPPLARHKNEDEVTEAITWSDGSDQLWATYGIQIVNCVRYPSGSRKYSILVWWCNYECWLLKPSTAKHIPNKPAIQYKK